MNIVSFPLFVLVLVLSGIVLIAGGLGFISTLYFYIRDILKYGFDKSLHFLLYLALSAITVLLGVWLRKVAAKIKNNSSKLKKEKKPTVKLGKVTKITGHISWAPPKWYVKLQEKTEKRKSKLSKWSSKNKKTIKKSLIWAVCVILLGVGGYVWYQSLPKPVKLKATVYAPGLTKLQKEMKPEPLKIKFSQTAAPLKDIEKEVKKGIEITPKIKGSWRWMNDRLLIFSPKSNWGVGQEYEIEFEKNIFPDNIKIESYKYNFHSAPFKMHMEKAKFYQDPRDPRIKRVVATVKFSHVVDTDEFEKRIFLRMGDKNKGFLGFGKESYPFSVTYDEFKGEAYIQSDPIKIPMEEKKMEVIIKKGVSAHRGGEPYSKTLVSSVKIPGMYNYFRINKVFSQIIRNEKYEAEQVLILNTTNGVLESEIQDNISVYLLPTYRPAIPGDNRRINNYRWGNVQIIGPEVLSHSEKVELTPIPTDKEFATTHSFKYDAKPGRKLYVKINEGVQSFGGYILAKTYDKIVRVPHFPREIKIMHDGSVMSLSGDKKITVLSNNIKGIKASFARVIPGQINHLVSQTRGNLRSPYFKNYHFSPDNITQVFEKKIALASQQKPTTQYTTLDFSQYLNGSSQNKRGMFFLKVESWDPRNDRTTGKRDKRLILLTDLGLLVKKEKDGHRYLFVQSIPNGRPVKGVRVQAVGKNGVPLITKTSDSSGAVKFPPLESFKNEQAPTVFIARRGDDVSFIPYEWGDRRLNYSRFDVGGIMTSIDPKKLQAYLFSDRGIYRPGDEIRVGYIIKRGDWRPELRGIPLETEIIDPRGMQIKKNNIRLSATGFDEIKYTTEEVSPTGNYQFKVYLVKDNRRHSLLGSVTVKVEEFLPDRMKITTKFSEDPLKGWVSPEDLKGLVNLRNLFGAPAENRRITANIAAIPISPSFRDYRDYTFINPNRNKEKRLTSYTEKLEDKVTDKNGEVDFEFDLYRFKKAFYRLDFLARGYEAKGGRSVSSVSSVLVSDLPYLLGYDPDGKMNYIKRGTDIFIDIIAVGSDLKKRAVREGLRLNLIERRHVSSLVKKKDGTYQYQSVEKEEKLKSEKISIPENGLKYRLPTKEPGHFIISIEDNEGFELLRAPFSVIGQANLVRSLERNAELQVSLEKEDYEPGETIQMQITAPYEGAGIITIEREKIYAYKWFKTSKTNSVQTIKVPADLEGNGYVNVSFVRDIGSKEIFMSPLSYAAVPFTVSLKGRTNDIQLDIPEVGLPGEEYKIKYKSQSRAKIIIFAVDEGILQVAKYETPDPLSEFFKKRALEVKTSQIADLILPEFHVFQNLFSPGGGYGRSALDKNLNPFKRKRQKPVAYWSGIIDTGPDWKEVSFEIPDYFNGTIRVMAVAVNNDTVGVAERKGLVRGPFVLSPNVPTFVSPGDEFEVSVGVFNNVEDSGDKAEISVKLEISEHFEVENKTERTLRISEGREDAATFRVKALNKLGSGNFTFQARRKDQTTKYSVGISIRPAIPYMVDVQSGYLDKKDKISLDVSRKMYPHYRKLNAAVSNLPMGLAHGLDTYLSNYAYPCTEQLVSQAVPAVVLMKHPGFGYDSRKAAAVFNEAVRILQARQNSKGGFGFWTANSHTSPFLSVYIMHILTEAKDSGFQVPSAVLLKGRENLRNLVNNRVTSLTDARLKAYALYVLTRQNVRTMQHADKLIKWMKKNKGKDWESDLAGIYMAAVYKMHHQDRQADSLIAESDFGEPQKVDYNHYYDNLLRDAGLLYVICRHFPDRVEKIDGDDLLNIVTPIIERKFNTTTAASAIMAFGAYSDAVGYTKTSDVEITEIDDGENETKLKLPAGAFPKIEFSEEAVNLLIDNLSSGIMFYQATQAGFDVNLPEKPISKNLEIYREYREVGGPQVNEIKLGDEIEVHLRLRSLDKKHHNNIAVVDLLPGGFEVVQNPGRRVNRNVRIAAPESTWNAQYADIREDRVVLFGTVKPEAKELIYKIRATNKGEYTVPPAYGESMYNQNIKMRGTPSTFKIKE